MVGRSANVSAHLDHHRYYMGIALAVREGANCLGSRVGAVLVVRDRVVATGYNGTPSNMTNCEDGGCERCRNREQYKSGQGYDVCICVHAEQNALLTAARFGIPVAGSTLYTTTRPCFGCTKELLQAQVEEVYFLHDWQHPDERLRHQYELIQSRISNGIRQLEMEDSRATWAMPPRAAMPAESGHSVPGNEEGLPPGGEESAPPDDPSS